HRSVLPRALPSFPTRRSSDLAIGRWFPAGSSMEEGDVNSPNAESIIRQILYGNNWFRKEFGMASDEYMLPDCFGFPASLPSILRSEEHTSELQSRGHLVCRLL